MKVPLKLINNNIKFLGMFRRAANTLLEPTINGQLEVYPNPFAKPETLTFGWLTSFAPCFPISAKNIEILSTPSLFYEKLLEGCKKATKRITIASLYIGTGQLELDLINALKSNNNFNNGQVRANFLIDYHRGSRFTNNSRTVLQSLLDGHEKNCTVSLYHTPNLRGLKKRLVPDRWNELAGLQHMKLYIFDDTLIISGANLSNDYFTNRQDRYYVIKDKRLCDFYDGLVGKVQKFSLTMDSENNVGLAEGWSLLPYEASKTDFVNKAAELVEKYLADSKEENNAYISDKFDTWIFPLIQMGQFQITHDSLVTDRIFGEARDGSKLCVSTGYFNLTNQYMNTIIEESKASCDILMAHPKANGFLGAQGAAGGIPFAYSLIAHRFKQQVEKSGQQHRIKLLEYLREGWTFHGKGLWYYPPKSDLPCLTLIGSPNFGGRSVTKDLETQVAIVTENADLQQELHNECSRLYKLGLPAETERKVAKWVYGFVFFFRNYF